ncbi:hypothetical protein [Streptomyces katrae]|nr:hypothetical protein [Streptomyces katrae]
MPHQQLAIAYQAARQLLRGSLEEIREPVLHEETAPGLHHHPTS